MAATNFTPIQLYFSTTASAAPTAANLAQGELAINITDGKLYYEDGGGVVQVIATKGAGTIGGSTTQIQYNNAGALAGNAAMVFDSGTSTTTLTTLNLTNALGAIYGGTAQSTYAQGDIVYASATNTLSKLGIGTVNYILTSSGSVPQWVAPSSIAVLTATNLDGGAAGSVPYQSGVATTTFLAIGTANRVMTSSGTAPQWVTSLTGLTGVSSSSITNTGLTAGRVVISSTAGLESDSANLTFDGTTLSTTGLSNTGFSTLVKTLTLGNSSFNGTAVFAAATPAKLYMGTGTVTDVTSAISATNTTGAIASLAITPIAATNTGVTYTNASTLYIAGAPSAGTNITITNPYSLYVAAGAVNLGGNTAVGGTLSATGLATLTGSAQILGSNVPASGSGVEFRGGATPVLAAFNRTGTAYLPMLYTASSHTFDVSATTIATVSSTGLAITGTLSATGGITSNNSASQGFVKIDGAATGSPYVAFQQSGVDKGLIQYINATSTLDLTVGAGVAKLSNTGLAVTGTLSSTLGATIQGLTVGLGAGAVSTNTAVGASALAANTTGQYNTVFGNGTGNAITTSQQNSFFGYQSGFKTTGGDNTGSGSLALYNNTSGGQNTAIGRSALESNTTASNNTAVGYQAGYANTTGTGNTFLGTQAGLAVTTSNGQTFIGSGAGAAKTTGGNNTFVGTSAGGSATTGTGNTFIGVNDATNGSGFAVTTGSKNTIIGGYTGNQGGLDIRTASNYIVLSDGDGNPQGYHDATNWYFPSVDAQTTGSAANVNVGTNGVLRKSTSSLKYKRDVQNATHGLAELLQLRSVTYKSKASLDGDTTYGGLIAEEVDAAGLSEFVMYAPDGTPDALAYGNMVSLCIKAMQEQQAIINSLKARLDAANI